MSLSTQDKASALAGVPLFAGISAESMERLAAVTGEQEFTEGQFVARQGQVGTGLYVILSGSVKVLRGSDELVRLGKGEFFGELSVIDQHPRNASVQAAEPTEVLALASWDLLSLLESDPQLSLNMIKGLVTRIRLAGEQHGH
ncbi:MAG: family transcriptional regulator, cyclic receptor protein [Chloroflexota bacterium]|jgi:CRP/FNR family cyclic AMP-dependent transcriptional regulator|nr:family transcriptional regulator, cyclic receptor protein [Chloroflexota bacterium]